MTGDADESHESLVAGRCEGFDRAAGTMGDVPLVRFDEIVELDQIDVIDTEPDE